MIKQLIFVRHGQSEANAIGVYAGQSNVQLTEHGCEQAAAAGMLLKRETISHIIVSDLDRAHFTAEIIAKTIGFPSKDIIIDSNLREINVGKLTGKPDEGFTSYLEYSASRTDDNAETMEQVETRLFPFIEGLKNHNGDTILIVAHAGVGRVLRAMLTGVDISKLAKLDVPNAQPIYLPVDLLNRGAL